MIEFRDVHKHFGPLHVLNGIDLSVAEREVVVIIGPSGSGKSTLIRTINGLEAIESGTLVVNGIAVHAEHVDVNRLRKDVGMVFQSFNLFPHLTAIENVMLAPLKVRKLGSSRRSASRRRPTSPRCACPGASSNASPSPAPSPWSPASCCSTSPRARSTPR